jgi:hypothetical protein
MSEALDAVKRLTAVAEKLLHETERLRGDVARLNARLDPIEGDEDDVYDEPPPLARVKWPVPDALNVIDQARRNILNCEHELSAIRARVDTIAEDVVSREEIKHLIKNERS